jgi:hypothetical protein
MVDSAIELIENPGDIFGFAQQVQRDGDQIGVGDARLGGFGGGVRAQDRGGEAHQMPVQRRQPRGAAGIFDGGRAVLLGFDDRGEAICAGF